MYRNDLISGTSLPDRTLSLTFDDGPGDSGEGPGPQTAAMAEFLSSQGVHATFFMVGRFASERPDLVARVRELGHTIGNHTYDHPQMSQFAAAGGDVVGQIARTDAVLGQNDGPIFVRPPYGTWDGAVAGALNGNLTTALRHVGPVGWDIDGRDWEFWKNDQDPNDCVAEYIREVDQKRRGILLMHDSSADQGFVRLRNRTFEVVRTLIPDLKARGYQFVPLHAVPGIAHGDERKARLTLRGNNGLFVSPQGGGGGPIVVSGAGPGSWEALTIEDLHVGRVALQASNGQYISPQNGGGADVLANGQAVGDWEPLDLVSLGNNQVAFRTMSGHFLRWDGSGGDSLNANGPWLSIEPSNIFTYEFV
jgi:peptidoglycan/xylan/chitin deacetylase (PgdA/CDA1 family)